MEQRVGHRFKQIILMSKLCRCKMQDIDLKHLVMKNIPQGLEKIFSVSKAVKTATISLVEG